MYLRNELLTIYNTGKIMSETVVASKTWDRLLIYQIRDRV